MAHLRDAVEEVFQRTGTPPATPAELGLALPKTAGPPPAAGIENGRIEIVFGPTADSAISGQSLYLTPFETAEQHVVWICGNRLPGVGLKPLGFAGGANLAVHEPTSIEPRFLPRMCR